MTQSALSRKLIETWVERIWNAGAFEELSHFHPDTFMNEGRPSTLDDAQAWHERMRATFSDLHYTIDDVVAAEDRVAFRWSASGTHVGPLWGFVPPTDKPIRWNGMHIVRIEDGKIAEIWAVSNTLAQLQQMGVQLQPASAE